MNIKEKFENFLDEQRIKKEMEIIKAKRAEEAKLKAEKMKKREESRILGQSEKIETENIENLPAEKKKFKFNMEQVKELRVNCDSSSSYRSSDMLIFQKKRMELIKLLKQLQQIIVTI